MIRVFFRFRGKNTCPLITHAADDLLKKFAKWHGVDKRTVLAKVAERAARENEKEVSEDLLLRYLADEATPLFAEEDAHDVRATLTTYTCRSCRGGPSIARDLAMSERHWEVQVSEFFGQHPSTPVHFRRRAQ